MKPKLPAIYEIYLRAFIRGDEAPFKMYGLFIDIQELLQSINLTGETT